MVYQHRSINVISVPRWYRNISTPEGTGCRVHRNPRDFLCTSVNQKLFSNKAFICYKVGKECGPGGQCDPLSVFSSEQVTCPHPGLSAAGRETVNNVGDTKEHTASWGKKTKIHYLQDDKVHYGDRDSKGVQTKERRRELTHLYFGWPRLFLLIPHSSAQTQTLTCWQGK